MTKVRAVGLLVLVLASTIFAAEPPRPKLIVQISVDQLRGDLPLRYQQRFSEGGFRRFLRDGVWYAAANQPHACTETVVGHTTLATATYPSRHGMVANSWTDPNGNTVNNIEDKDFPVLPIRGGEPSQGSASPRAILTTTFSDELMIATDNHARVFAVSGKERSAVPLAGHTGKAFWYSDQIGCYVTSTFYYPKYPQWVTSWCDARAADKYKKRDWTLPEDADETYVYGKWHNNYDDPPNSPDTPAARNMAYLRDKVGFNSTFPHPLADNPGFYRSLTLTPYFDSLTVEFAEALLRNENLGHGTSTDYLAISLSATDYIGHWFSPSSLESEDNILRLDLTLNELLTTIDKEVGLDKTLVVLSADHGGAEYPEFLKIQKVNTGRLTECEIWRTAYQALKEKYKREDLIRTYSSPYFYVNRQALDKLSLREVEETIAGAVSKMAGIALAVPSEGSTSGADTDAELVQRIRRNYHHDRSGDVYVVQDAQWQIDEEQIAKEQRPCNLQGKPPDKPQAKVPQLLQHEAPWAYDTYVPIAFTGAGVVPQMVYRSVATVDVAATLAAYARTNQPSASVGTPLVEVFQSKK